MKSELINNPKRAKQVIAYDGIKSKKVHPTDIDALLEFDGKYLILIELKVKGNKVPKGQRLALERIAVKWVRDGGEAWIVYASHDTKDDEIIFLKDCDIFEIWSSKRTLLLEKTIKVKSFLRELAISYKIDKLKL